MAKDAVATMGEILTPDVGGRDAVHVAVVSATAGQKLYPGQDVGRMATLGPGGEMVAGQSGEPIGIVDPYLKGAVMPEQRFWLYLYPRSITSLRHNWTHPAFEDVKETYSAPAGKLASEQWLRAFCEHADCPPYEQLIAIIDGGSVADEEYSSDPITTRNDGEFLTIGGRDAGGSIPDEFWDHVETVTGRKFNRARYFSCSC